MNRENVPASSLPGPVRGPTYVNALAKWCLERNRDVAEDYRTLIELEVISSNCASVYEVAEADCERAIVALRNLEWL